MDATTSPRRTHRETLAHLAHLKALKETTVTDPIQARAEAEYAALLRTRKAAGLTPEGALPTVAEAKEAYEAQVAHVVRLRSEDAPESDQRYARQRALVLSAEIDAARQRRQRALVLSAEIDAARQREQDAAMERPTRDDDYTPEAMDRAAEAETPRTFRARSAAVAGWAHAEAVMAFAREVAAEALEAAALDVDNETVAAILREHAAQQRR